jgi:hypothetical protein
MFFAPPNKLSQDPSIDEEEALLPMPWCRRQKKKPACLHDCDVIRRARDSQIEAVSYDGRTFPPI